LILYNVSLILFLRLSVPFLSFFFLAKKLRALNGEIKRWNCEVFGNVRVRNKARSVELELLDSIEESRGLTEEEKERRKGLVTDLEASLLQEEISWRQKSRV
jgi:hypothetical protein